MGLRGSRFYCSFHTVRVIESDQAIYFEDDTSTSQGPREIVLKKHSNFIIVPIAYVPISSPVIDQYPIATTDDELIDDVDPIAPYVDLVALDIVMDIPSRRSYRTRRPAISYDYIVYLQEHEYDMGDVSYLTTYKEAIASP